MSAEVYEWNPGEANPKQKLFFASRKLYTGYGGAKGGGKTWAVRTKALLGAYNYPGIRILIMRRTYPELQSNHIEPMLKLVEPSLASYNGSLHSLYFVNGSLIHFGHWAGEQSELEYNGQEYDWIFLDEATQFTWRAFQFLGGLLRGVNDFPKRFYVTCNPGGVGHRWVKRLFIDRDFITGRENPEENENPDDYCFIPATVEDNTALLKSSPGYLRMLSAMPENLRRAYRYGEWDALGGNYFPELREDTHLAEPFAIPRGWRRYRAFDYGLDMFACAWFAVDESGRSDLLRIHRDPVACGRLRLLHVVGRAYDQVVEIKLALAVGRALCDDFLAGHIRVQGEFRAGEDLIVLVGLMHQDPERCGLILHPDFNAAVVRYFYGNLAVRICCGRIALDDGDGVVLCHLKLDLCRVDCETGRCGFLFQLVCAVFQAADVDEAVLVGCIFLRGAVRHGVYELHAGYRLAGRSVDLRNTHLQVVLFHGRRLVDD